MLSSFRPLYGVQHLWDLLTFWLEPLKLSKVIDFPERNHSNYQITSNHHIIIIIDFSERDGVHHRWRSSNWNQLHGQGAKAWKGEVCPPNMLLSTLPNILLSTKYAFVHPSKYSSVHQICFCPSFQIFFCPPNILLSTLPNIMPNILMSTFDQMTMMIWPSSGSSSLTT